MNGQNEKAKPGWRMLKFGDIAQNVVERVDPANAEGDVYIGLEHLDPETLHLRTWGKPSDVIGEKLAFKKGDVIFGRRRAYQRKLAIAEFDGICSAHAMVVRTKPKVMLPEFLPFFLQSDMFMERAIGISVGSLSPTINWTTLRNEEFPLPPIEDQMRIAEILWAADEALERYTRAVHETEVLLSTLRNREHSLRSIIPLGAILKVIVAGKSVRGASDPASASELGVLKVSAIGPNGFAPSENKRVLAASDFVAKYCVKRGSLLITRCNTTALVGRVCITNADYPNLMLCDKTLEIVIDEAKCDKTYVFEALRTDSVRGQIAERATGTGGAMKNISQNDIKSLLIPQPPLDTQRRMAGHYVDIYAASNRLSTARNSVREMIRAFANTHLNRNGACHVR